MEYPLETVDKLKWLLSDVSTDLTFYNQIFGKTEDVQVLKEFSDWVFSNYQRCLTDSIFSKLSKLLDPDKTCGLNNLSFSYVIKKHSLSKDLDIKNSLSEIQSIYKTSGLKKYRNKVLAHNDSTSIENAHQNTIFFENGIEVFLSKMWDLFALLEFKTGLKSIIPKYGTGIIIPAEMGGETFLLKLRKCM
jgi:hypothetical protein